MLIGRLHRDRRGDTIVEVMIVLAVLGLAIGISYATANRSLLNARQAQENSLATAGAQSQVEQLVSIGCTSGDPACDITNHVNPGYALLHPPGNEPFCIINGTVKAYDDTTTDPTCASQVPLPGAKVCIVTTITSNSDPDCKHQAGLPNDVFEVIVSWDNALGKGRDTVTQDYVLPSVSGGGGGGGGGGGVVNSIAVSDPGDQTTFVSQSASLQINATDSDPSQTLTYAASGLPSGLSIDSSTGRIHGTPSNTGNYNGIVVTVTDGSGASGSITFDWTVNAVPAFTFSLAGSATCTGRTFNVDVTITGPPGDSVAVNYSGAGYAGTGGRFTIGSDGTVTGTVSGSYIPGSHSVTLSAQLNGVTKTRSVLLSSCDHHHD